jgi:hypothetical protein
MLIAVWRRQVMVFINCGKGRYCDNYLLFSDAGIRIWSERFGIRGGEWADYVGKLINLVRPKTQRVI